MSRASLIVFVATIAVIVYGVIFDLTFARSGAGAMLLFAIGYAYTVTQRELQLLNYAATNQGDEDEEDDDVLLLVDRA